MDIKLMHIPGNIGENIVGGRPVWIDPDNLRVDFKVRLADVRAAHKPQTAGNPALSYKR